MQAAKPFDYTPQPSRRICQRNESPAVVPSVVPQHPLPLTHRSLLACGFCWLSDVLSGLLLSRRIAPTALGAFAAPPTPPRRLNSDSSAHPLLTPPAGMPQTRSSARGKASAQSDTAATASRAQDAQTATTASSSRLASNVGASTSQGTRQAGGDARKDGKKKRKSGGRKKRSRRNEDDEDADASGESSRRPAKRKKGKRRVKVEELSDFDAFSGSDDGGGQPPTPPPKDARWLPPPEPVDRLTDLPRELLQQILSCVLLPSEAGGQADRHSLARLALANRKLAVQVRSALYRELDIDTRVQAHAIHRTLHGQVMARGVKRLTANIENMVKASSSWPGASRSLPSPLLRMSSSSLNLQAGSRSTRCTRSAASSVPAGTSSASRSTSSPTRPPG